MQERIYPRKRAVMRYRRALVSAGASLVSIRPLLRSTAIPEFQRPPVASCRAPWQGRPSPCSARPARQRAQDLWCRRGQTHHKVSRSAGVDGAAGTSPAAARCQSGREVSLSAQKGGDATLTSALAAGCLNPFPGGLPTSTSSGLSSPVLSELVAAP
jgi:hypothetical protein